MSETQSDNHSSKSQWVTNTLVRGLIKGFAMKKFKRNIFFAEKEKFLGGNWSCKKFEI
jgi:hypothetical protein